MGWVLPAGKLLGLRKVFSVPTGSLSLWLYESYVPCDMFAVLPHKFVDKKITQNTNMSHIYGCLHEQKSALVILNLVYMVFTWYSIFLWTHFLLWRNGNSQRLLLFAFSGVQWRRNYPGRNTLSQTICNQNSSNWVEGIIEYLRFFTSHICSLYHYWWSD